MKKFLSFLLVLSMLFVSLAFVACEEEEVKKPITNPLRNPVGDKEDIKYDSVLSKRYTTYKELSEFLSDVKFTGGLKMPSLDLTNEASVLENEYSFESRYFPEEYKKLEKDYIFYWCFTRSETEFFSKDENFPLFVTVSMYPTSKVEFESETLTAKIGRRGYTTVWNMVEYSEEDSDEYFYYYVYEVYDGSYNKESAPLASVEVVMNVEDKLRIDEVLPQILDLIRENTVFPTFNPREDKEILQQKR